MSILKAMNSGVSGLASQGKALGIVGDNVANSSTIGFKSSRAVFEDVLGGAVGRPGEIGSGVRMVRAQQIFAQGTLLTTGQATDLALTGDGFFVVSGTVNGVAGEFYSRAGQFTVAADGSLINPQGLQLMGYMADSSGQVTTDLGPLSVPTGALSPQPTSEMNITANLDANATPPAAAWDPTDPANTSNFSTSMTVYDSLGNGHSVDVYFTNTGSGTWDYHAVVDGGELAGGTAGVNTEIATGSITFDSAGALQSVTPGAGGTADFVGATPGQALSFNFGSPIAAGGTGLGGTTGFGSPSSITSQSQDGFASGELTGVNVDGDGTIMGVYSNGEKLAIGQVAVAKFASNDGLGRAGQNLWTSTRESGEAVIGAAGTGGRASVVSGALEQSNVDIANEFVNLIGHQRGFQANSRTITTADEMLQEVVNLKR